MSGPLRRVNDYWREFALVAAEIERKCDALPDVAAVAKAYKD